MGYVNEDGRVREGTYFFSGLQLSHFPRARCIVRPLGAPVSNLLHTPTVILHNDEVIADVEPKCQWIARDFFDANNFEFRGFNSGDGTKVIAEFMQELLAPGNNVGTELSSCDIESLVSAQREHFR